MKEELLESAVKNMVLQSLPNVYLFDVFNDAVTSYAYVDGKFTTNNKVTLTSYLEDIKTNVQEQYLKEYMNSVSIPKLEENLKEGKNSLSFEYKTLNNKSYKNTCSLIENNNVKCILVLNEEVKSNNEVVTLNDNAKFNTLVENISDAILKITNIFNLDSKSKANIEAVESYINSVFSSLTSTYPEVKKAVNKTAASVSGMVDDAILIVDDDLVTRNMIKKIFADDYKIIMANNGKEAIEFLEANANKSRVEKSDNILGIFLDLTMPVLDGFAVLEYLSKKNYLSKLPVIIISGDYEKATKTRVYNYNIADMLEKPFDFEVVKHRIGNFINLYKSSNSLGEIINEQNSDLKDIINAFVYTYRYDYEENIRMIKEYINILGNQVVIDYPEYNLTSSNISKMVEASEYYDIGFYSIPRTILNKKTNFTDEELRTIKDYPLFGSKMINYVLSLISDAKLKDYANDIATHYHENFDGTGYPNKLLGEDIPISAQIAAVAITYNNLRKKNIPNIDDTIISKSGTMFNPKIVGSFMKVMSAFKEVK